MRAQPHARRYDQPPSTDLQAAVDTARGFRVSSLSLGLDRLGASGSPALAAAIGFALVVVIALQVGRHARPHRGTLPINPFVPDGGGTTHVDTRVCARPY